ncbi:MAG: PLP-dependent aminotransferase family protein [Desulfobacteraceae bacterium]|nr:MAG: PLP-dependent aminotransferase family protein [Desulfobacteraceae bacterium]
MKTDNNFRYVTLANEIETGIMDGTFSPGDKLPSLRKLHGQLGLSVSTIHQAYIELEKRGRVEAREKSGFYVKALHSVLLGAPVRHKTESKPCRVSVNDLAQTIVADLQNEKILPLGAAIPSNDLMPLKQLSRIMKSIPSSEMQLHLSKYDYCQGDPELREQLSKKMLSTGCAVNGDNIITSSGCMDSVSLCLRAVAGPGDTILVESPVFHCFLQLIEDLNMYVLEIPGCPETGIDPAAFEKALATNTVKACLLNPNFQNPLGSVIPSKNKQRIVKIAARYDIPIIEDDIYTDLYYGQKRPSTLKRYDTRGMVLYCSSFSKTLAPGFRAGWISPGRFYDKIIRLKLNSYISNASITHTVIAQFMKSGAYDRHLRRLRNQVKNQASAVAIAISKYFPPHTKITFPTGGMFIWVELPQNVDSMEVYHEAYKRRISVLPGILCSSTDRFSNCLRINCGQKWSPRIENAINTIGKIVKHFEKQRTNH